MRQKQFLGSLMERDDITVICEGLYDHSHFINTEYMKDFLYDLGYNFGTIPYGKFRQFNRIVTNTVHDETTTTKEHVTYEEVDGYRFMNVMSEYIPYLKEKVFCEARPEKNDIDETKDSTENATTAPTSKSTALTASVSNLAILASSAALRHIDHDDNNNNDGTDNGLKMTNDSATAAEATTSSNTTSSTNNADVLTAGMNGDSCLYMTDVEMATFFPRFDYEYKQQFKMKEILPGGTWCLMNHVGDCCFFNVTFCQCFIHEPYIILI